MALLGAWLNSLGGWLTAHLWPLSIELAVLTAVVAAIVYGLRVRAPAIRHLFWTLVLVKPAVTLLIASPVSLYWFLHTGRPEATPPQSVGISTSPPAAWRQRSGWWMERPVFAPVGSGAEVRETPRLTRGGVVGLAWLCIGVLLALRIAAGAAYVAYLRRTAEPGPHWLAEALAEVACRLGVRRRVQLAASDLADGPVLAGIIRPTVILPKQLAGELRPDQLRLVLAHEVAHVRRHDNLVLLVQRIVEAFVFFHPAIWLCGWMLRREAEAACDDAVVSAFGTAEQYADSLTRVAEMRAGLTRLLLNAFASGESHMARRVRRILGGGGGRMTAQAKVIFTLLLLAIACAALPSAASRTGQGRASELPAPAASSTALILNGQPVDLGEPVLYFGVATLGDDAQVLVPVRAVFQKLGYLVEWRGGKDEYVSVGGYWRVQPMPPGGGYVLVKTGEVKVCEYQTVLPVPPQRRGGRLYAPMSLIRILTGSTLAWDGSAGALTCTTHWQEDPPLLAISQILDDLPTWQHRRVHIRARFVWASPWPSRGTADDDLPAPAAWLVRDDTGEIHCSAVAGFISAMMVEPITYEPGQLVDIEGIVRTGKGNVPYLSKVKHAAVQNEG